MTLFNTGKSLYKNKQVEFMVESTCTTVQKNTTKDIIKLGSNKSDSGFYNDVKKQRNMF